MPLPAAISVPPRDRLFALLLDLQHQHQELVEVLQLAIDDYDIQEIPALQPPDHNLPELLKGYSRFVEDRIQGFLHDDR